MNFIILSLFPQIFPGPLGYSISGSALRKKMWSYDVFDLRDFGVGKNKKVDDTNYGGGNGLVIRPDVISNAIDHISSKYNLDKIIYLSPKGSLFNQRKARDVSLMKNVLIICGRFDGIDERILRVYNVDEISIGDYILFGGEVAALVVMESCIRLLDGIVKNRDSLSEDSFGKDGSSCMLEHPIYTKPSNFMGITPPDVLLSGNHKEISTWRALESLKLTKERRPDLIKDKL